MYLGVGPRTLQCGCPLLQETVTQRIDKPTRTYVSILYSSVQAYIANRVWIHHHSIGFVRGVEWCVVLKVNLMRSLWPVLTAQRDDTDRPTWNSQPLLHDWLEPCWSQAPGRVRRQAQDNSVRAFFSTPVLLRDGGGPLWGRVFSRLSLRLVCVQRYVMRRGLLTITCLWSSTSSKIFILKKMFCAHTPPHVIG